MDFWFRAWTGEAAQNAETSCEHPDWLSGLRGRGHPGNFWYQDSKSTRALPAAGTHARCFPSWLATLCHTFKPSQVPPRPPRALLILELFLLWFILPLHKDFLHIMRQSIPKFTCYSPYSPVSGTALRPKAILRSSWKEKKKKRMNECRLNFYLFWLRGVFVVVKGLHYPEAYTILGPQPGMEHASPTLEGKFFTPRSPGKYLP